MAYMNITAALRAGARLSAHRQAEFARIVRIEELTQSRQLVGFAEGEHIEDALRIANSNVNTFEGRYPTDSARAFRGSESIKGPLDEWVFRMNSFTAWAEGESIVVEMLNPRHRDPVPEGASPEQLSSPYAATKTGRGPTLGKALEEALTAPLVAKIQ